MVPISSTISRRVCSGRGGRTARFVRVATSTYLTIAWELPGCTDRYERGCYLPEVATSLTQVGVARGVVPSSLSIRDIQQLPNLLTNCKGMSTGGPSRTHLSSTIQPVTDRAP